MTDDQAETQAAPTVLATAPPLAWSAEPVSVYPRQRWSAANIAVAALCLGVVLLAAAVVALIARPREVVSAAPSVLTATVTTPAPTPATVTATPPPSTITAAAPAPVPSVVAGSADGDAYVALAISDANQVAYGTSETQDRANKIATTICERGGNGCVVAAWAQHGWCAALAVDGIDWAGAAGPGEFSARAAALAKLPGGHVVAVHCSN